VVEQAHDIVDAEAVPERSRPDSFPEATEVFGELVENRSEAFNPASSTCSQFSVLQETIFCFHVRSPYAMVMYLTGCEVLVLSNTESWRTEVSYPSWPNSANLSVHLGHKRSQPLDDGLFPVENSLRFEGDALGADALIVPAPHTLDATAHEASELLLRYDVMQITEILEAGGGLGCF
jgi:hypothetical protein